ncbi:MAG: peptide-methionine (S)-S-oxide reductase MsrA [Actinobacteria bacterium ATB1]|nr:peptide-methionine (S)-S-oxide reductase MsrA [Actinobacteria bacterium ATB1]
MSIFGRRATALPGPGEALPGRTTPVHSGDTHHVTGRPLHPPFPTGLVTAVFGMGCFWGAERLFWEIPGVWTTAVGYAAGTTPNPTYEEVCSGRTGHTEAVLVVFDPGAVAYVDLLRRFWEGHDPTQGMRQGNDVGTQYRSLVGTTSESQTTAATESRAAYAASLSSAGYGPITTEIVRDPSFYHAEDYHQQYLSKNPFGYCGIGGTGIACPTSLHTPD